jgi:hypothetical protein
VFSKNIALNAEKGKIKVNVSDLLKRYKLYKK